MILSEFLSQSLKDVETLSYKCFDNLLKQKDEFNFVNKVVKGGLLPHKGKIEYLKDACELHLLPTIERRSDINGSVDDVHVTLVTSERIEVVRMSDEKVMDIKLSDVASIEDKVILLTEMEKYLYK